jgi:adenosylcobinamide-GDP ribazoletransferase
VYSFALALTFLTVLPVPLRGLPDAGAVARSRFWYPVVGALLGALVGGLAWCLASVHVSSSIAAFLVLLAWVALTGALHLDGLCDVCDGVFARGTAEDRLRILKDPHLGTFGLAGGVLLLLGKFVVLSEVLARWGPEAAWPVGAAVAVARCLALCVAAGARYPRPEGTGKILVEATRGWEAIVYVAAAVGLAFLASGGREPWEALLPVVPSLAPALALRLLCVARLGGITGDCLGAAVEIAELTFLLGVLLCP